MKTVWIEEKQLSRTLDRNEAFWSGELEDGPLMWITVPGAKPSPSVPEPASEDELWTNVDYVMAATDRTLGGTHYAGDALPVFCPWLGPALSAIRHPENLAMDLLNHPDAIHRAMRQMTDLWKVD